MYTKEQAQSKMQEFVDFQNNLAIWNGGENLDIIIYDELTQEHEFGWVFFWQMRDEEKTVLIGNGPIIIERETLDLYAMMTAYTVEENIQLYLENKNQLGKMEPDDDGIWDVVDG
jgi:hypothetical protein